MILLLLISGKISGPHSTKHSLVDKGGWCRFDMLPPGVCRMEWRCGFGGWKATATTFGVPEMTKIGSKSR